MNVEMRLGSDDRVLLVMPLFHIGAMFIGLGAHFRGGTAVLHRQFDPAAALNAIAADRVTALHLAPTLLQALVDAAAGRPDALAGVRTVVYSAAPITGPTLAAAMQAMPEAGFLNLYGQTEVVSTGLPREFHAANGDERSRRRLRSVGLPFPGNEVRITAEDGSQCPPGSPARCASGRPPCSAGTGTTARRPPRCCATGGATPATSGCSTRTACCTWSTARRT
jgi:acyl-CoA synthetase (AMP-forming)/AMP-acid ligase II